MSNINVTWSLSLQITDLNLIIYFAEFWSKCNECLIHKSKITNSEVCLSDLFCLNVYRKETKQSKNDLLYFYELDYAIKYVDKTAASIKIYLNNLINVLSCW